MRERPILFRGEMVRAIVEGRKTQTRRVLKPGPTQAWLTSESLQRVQRFEHRKDGWWAMAVGEPRRIVHCGVEMDGGHIGSIRCPYVVGDRLWVRETWCRAADADGRIIEGKALYAADGGEVFLSDGDGGTAWRKDGRARSPWRPSIYMPRWACRLVLEVTDVRVEKLQAISREDALAEGVGTLSYGGAEDVWLGADLAHPGKDTREPQVAFRWLWDSIHGGDSWEANPWVWVVEFKRVQP